MQDLGKKRVYAPAIPKGAEQKKGDYDGAELRRAPGVLPGRFRAFSLPSRMGNNLYYPDGRIECIETN